MINSGDIIEVTIEKLTYGGLGLARYGEEKFVVFVENSLPEDILKVETVSKTRSYAKARILEIIKSKRIKPFCALYNACGSCDNQICSYEETLIQKELILKDIFKDYKINPIISSPTTLEYRKKVQFPCSETKNSKRKLIGYYKRNSHDLTNIKFCPLQPRVMNEINSFIRENFPLSAYSEKTHKGALKHICARFNLKNELLLVFIINDNKVDKKLNPFFEALKEKFSEIKGIFVNLNTDKTNKILGNLTLKALGEDFIIEEIEDKKYKIGPTSFFQVNPAAARELFKIVKENIEPNSSVLDAYGGVGAIGIFVSDRVKSTTLVEENFEATKLALDNFKLNSIENFEILSGDASQHFKKFLEEKRTFDCVILDPPRQGCKKEGLEAIAKIAKKIIYVSCNPQTLKRDLEILKGCNFKAESITGVDLFPYTHHIESVCVLQKSG